MFKEITKKLLIIMFVTMNILFISGCKNDSTEYIENSVAIVYKDNIPYIINDKNELFELSQYDSIVPIFDEILIVKKDGLFGYIKNTGEPLTEIVYNEAYPFSEGKAVVRINDSYYIIDQNSTILYTFSEGIISYSYFSDNKLVITKDEKQGYLKYDPETKFFSYLIENPKDDLSIEDTNIIYDYCGDFSNGYAVVGNLNENNRLKYTHINANGEKLYDLEWDYAHNFSEGYAVVGNIIDYSVKIYCGRQNWFDEYASTKINIMVYMYVDPSGKYIGSPYIDQETGETKINPYMYAMAKDFKDSVALVARLFFYVNEQKNNHIYDFSTKRFFYNYDFINYEGKPIFGRPGYEIAGSYNNWSGNVTMYGDFFKIDDYYIATFFKTNWHVYYTDVNNLDPAFPFKTAKYDISNYKTVEEIENNFPWVTKYLDDFTIGNNDAIYVSNMVVLPYTLSQFKTSSFLGDKLVAKAQSFSGMKDSCGLITINMVDSVVKENGEEKTIKIPQISYIVPPLYEEIIY